MSPGTLYVVATPLGNLQDMTERAAGVLRTVPLVAAEDTRRARILLGHINARGRVLSYHAHSPRQRVEELLARLAEGTDVALVTDAGTPTVSDPGASLVTQARSRGSPVVPIPGPSAVVTALSASGLSGDRFTFLGFVPRKGADRTRLLGAIAASPWTVVMYEAANRLSRLLEDLAGRCGPDREAVVARELTKVHEEVRTGTLGSLSAYYRDNVPRGEVTVVVAAAPVPDKKTFDPRRARERGRALLAAGESGKDAAATLASELGISRNDAYKVITSL